MSFLRQKGWGLILGSEPSDVHVYFSKSNLVKGGAKLSSMAIQGRNYVDISAFREREIILGIVISRVYVIAYRNGVKHLEKLLKMFLSSPNSAENSYRDLKDMGYDINSTNIAKLYKIYIAARGVNRLRRIYEQSETIRFLIVTPCLGIDISRDIVLKSVSEIMEFVSTVHGEERILCYEYACFRPKDITSGPPPIVQFINIVTEGVKEAVLSGEMNFIDIMGLEYKGCAKCRYVSTCVEMMKMQA